MIEEIPFDEPNIVGLRIDGKIDNEGFEKTVVFINTALAENDKINIYAEVKNLGGMSVETFFKNLKFKFKLFGELNRFGKEAIVTDKEWVQNAVKIGDKIFPSVEVRYFSFSDKETALAWVKELEPA